jgi:hypothetical protein
MVAALGHVTIRGQHIKEGDGANHDAKVLSHEVAVVDEARRVCTLPSVHDEDAYRDDTANIALTPEHWARAIFEDAPAPIRQLTYSSWRMCGYALGAHGSASHVHGWRIVEQTDETHCQTRRLSGR